MPDNTKNDRLPAKKKTGKFHYIPGNMAGKKVETGKSDGEPNLDERRGKDLEAKQNHSEKRRKQGI